MSNHRTKMCINVRRLARDRIEENAGETPALRLPPAYRKGTIAAMRFPSGRAMRYVLPVMLRVTAWAFVIAIWAALLFAYLLPQDFRNVSEPYIHFAWIALSIRVIQPHLGLALLPIALVSAFTRG